jgi:hypothetical protein
MTEVFLRITTEGLTLIERSLSHMRHVPAYRELHARVAFVAHPAGGDTTHGTAARIPFPKPRNHAEEIANARAEAAHR